MTTPLAKPVLRSTTKEYVGRHKDARGRKLVVGLLPGDVLMLRPARTKRVEYIALATIYDIALESRVRSERMQRLNAKRKKGTS